MDSAQPQPLVLAQHLRGAADQCELLGNLPAVNNAQMLQNIMKAVDDIGVRITAFEVKLEVVDNHVQALDNRVQALDNRVQTLDNRVQTLDNRVQTLDNRVQTLDDRMQAIDHNSQARLYNSELSSSQQALETIRTSANVEPVGFPLNSSQLSLLTAAQLNALFAAYSLPANGNVDAKRRRFRRFVGLMRDS